MNLSAWKQQLQRITPLTLMTWVCFVVLFGLFCGYAWQINTKEFSIQERLRRENRDLQAENRELERLNKEYEDYFLSLQSQEDPTQAQPSSHETAAAPEVEVEEGKERSFVYTVQKGDTVWDIATMYNVAVNDLLRWNNMTKRSRIFPGDELTIILKE